MEAKPLTAARRIPFSLVKNLLVLSFANLSLYDMNMVSDAFST